VTWRAMWTTKGYVGPRRPCGPIGLCGPHLVMWTPEGYVELIGLYGPQRAKLCPSCGLHNLELSAFLCERQIIHPVEKTLGRVTDSNCATVSCAIRSVATAQCCTETSCGNQVAQSAMLYRDVLWEPSGIRAVLYREVLWEPSGTKRNVV